MCLVKIPSLLLKLKMQLCKGSATDPLCTGQVLSLQSSFYKLWQLQDMIRKKPSAVEDEGTTDFWKIRNSKPVTQLHISEAAAQPNNLANPCIMKLGRKQWSVCYDTVCNTKKNKYEAIIFYVRIHVLHNMLMAHGTWHINVYLKCIKLFL
jgi:hypothetical protein